MKPTEKQKCISEQAVYGDLAIRDKDCFAPDYEIVKGFAIEDNKFCIETNFEESCILTESHQAILRPLSDLYKEITHKGYNDDKPFMPAAIICKMDLGGGYAINLGLNSLRERRHTKENDLLHLLHFDTRSLIEAGEAIDANTLDINPYSVQL